MEQAEMSEQAETSKPAEISEPAETSEPADAQTDKQKCRKQETQGSMSIPKDPSSAPEHKDVNIGKEMGEEIRSMIKVAQQETEILENKEKCWQ